MHRWGTQKITIEKTDKNNDGVVDENEVVQFVQFTQDGGLVVGNGKLVVTWLDANGNKINDQEENVAFVKE